MSEQPSGPSESDAIFHPLETGNLAESIAQAFLRRPLQPLPPADVPRGAGIYALYYFGDAAEYQRLSEHNKLEKLQIPLYVGKAMPRGSRVGISPAQIGFQVRTRLRNHARRVEEAEFELSDFRCRYLLLEPVWVPLGESLLIGVFNPVWNVAVSGFGNNPVGAGRAAQQRSNWDLLHPGRAWSSQLPEGATDRAEHLQEDISEHVEKALGDYPALSRRFSGFFGHEGDAEQQT